MNLRSKVITVFSFLSLSFGACASEQVHIRSLAASCASCHGTQGVALPGMESLAGRSKDDLLKLMLDFKTGKKPATIMHQLSKGYTDQELEQLAAHFAALKK